tara:strand:- start:209 stop:1093 length:885 start_codon:yes stop_codon:yes gene_type:complete
MSNPVKTREIHSNHFDSTVWNDVKFRNDDIVISTYGKSGTTWLQQILSQLIFNGKEGLPVAEMSPWVDLRIPPKQVKLPMIEAQTHRRFLKTHLPVDALVFKENLKYIYVARDGRDVAFSLFNHYANANEKWYEALNLTPGLVGDPVPQAPDSVVDFYETWLENDGAPFWPYWENVKSWWDIKDLPNVMFLHFSELKADMPAMIKKVAEFVGEEIDESKWDAILEHCSFSYMKQHADASVPLGGAFWDGGSKTFMNKGTNGRWRDVLTKEQSERYEQLALEKLGPECSEWLKGI